MSKYVLLLCTLMISTAAFAEDAAPVAAPSTTVAPVETQQIEKTPETTTEQKPDLACCRCRKGGGSALACSCSKKKKNPDTKAQDLIVLATAEETAKKPAASVDADEEEEEEEEESDEKKALACECGEETETPELQTEVVAPKKATV